jgi:hypothetical protein
MPSKQEGNQVKKVYAVAVGCAAVALTLISVGSVAQASHRVAPRPHPTHLSANTNTPGAVTAVNDHFGSSTGGWCTVSSGCDGNSYGTIDRVPSGFTDGGGSSYPSATSLVGSNMAVVTGTNDVNEGQGCPNLTETEFCTGPYYLPGGGNDFIFPTNGFTVTDDLYLNPAATTGLGDIDLDTALNSSSGTPFGAGGGGIDNVIGVCPGTGGLAVVFDHNSPSGCNSSDTGVITSAGWYRYVWIYTNTGGQVFLTEKVFQENGLTPTLVATSGAQPVEFGSDTSAEPIANVGGPAYTWLPTLNAPGMVPMANYAIQLGQHQNGHTP